MGIVDRLAGFLSVRDGGHALIEQSPEEERLLVRLRGEDGTANVGAAPVRLRLLFSGEVQGVGFRWTNQAAARERGLTGWVRNLDDGTVEMEVQGPPQHLAAHISAVHLYYGRFGNRIWLEGSSELACTPDEEDFAVRF